MFSNWFWLMPMLIAAALAAYVIFSMPQDRDVKSLGVFLFKLLPFIFASIGIATFPTSAPVWLSLMLVFATIIPFFAYFVPRQLFFLRGGLRAAHAVDPKEPFDPLEDEFAKYYVITQIVVPFVILMVTFAYRAGGGTTGNTLKLALAGILFMISGIEDIAFFAINGLGKMPDEIFWATHMTVRLGRIAKRGEFFFICFLHFVLIAIVFALPLDSLLAQIGLG